MNVTMTERVPEIHSSITTNPGKLPPSFAVGPPDHTVPLGLKNRPNVRVACFVLYPPRALLCDRL